MDEKEQRELEIAQLKRKVERHREALSAAKTEKANADHHMRRRITALEKKMVKADEQLLEMAKSLDDSVGQLSLQINDLTKKYNQTDYKRTEKTNKQVDYPPLEKTQHPKDLLPSSAIHSQRKHENIPSFKQLKQISQLNDMENNTFKQNTPSHFAPQKPLKGLSESVRVEWLPNEHKENPISERVYPVKTNLQETKAADLNERVNLNSTDIASPFWNKFKKK